MPGTAQDHAGTERPTVGGIPWRSGVSFVPTAFAGPCCSSPIPSWWRPSWPGAVCSWARTDVRHRRGLPQARHAPPAGAEGPHLTRLERPSAGARPELRIPADKAPALPPDTYFHWQLLGLSVVTEDGTILGQVAEILQTGANDVYLVRGDRELLLPATSEVIRPGGPASAAWLSISCRA